MPGRGGIFPGTIDQPYSQHWGEASHQHQQRSHEWVHCRSMLQCSHSSLPAHLESPDVESVKLLLQLRLGHHSAIRQPFIVRRLLRCFGTRLLFILLATAGCTLLTFPAALTRTSHPQKTTYSLRHALKERERRSRRVVAAGERIQIICTLSISLIHSALLFLLLYLFIFLVIQHRVRAFIVLFGIVPGGCFIPRNGCLASHTGGLIHRNVILFLDCRDRCRSSITHIFSSHIFCICIWGIDRDGNTNRLVRIFGIRISCGDEINGRLSRSNVWHRVG
mmetsp:Transcript_29793/g.41153  ORF Transcript_29793/g.41153 Transcript_29793/m.41153 type:complete len:278 (+) Transcript_29793:482-1315(+)